MSFEPEQEGGVWSPPWRWHIHAILLTAGGVIGVETCGLDGVFPTDDLCSRPETLYWYIYLYVCILYTSCVMGRIYAYTRSVVQYWRLFCHIYGYSASEFQALQLIALAAFGVRD